MLQLLSKLVTLVVISRLIPPNEFGLFQIGMSIAMIAAALAQLGIPTNIVVFEEIGKATTAAALLLGAGTSIIAAILCWIAQANTHGSDQALQEQVLIITGFYIVFQVAISTLEAVSRRSMHFRAIAVSEFAATVIGSLLVTAVLALLGGGVWALVVGQFVYGTVRLFGLLKANREAVGLRTNLREVRRIASASGAITIAEFANIATVYGQRPIIGFELGAAAAGLWSRFYQIILVQLTSTVQPVDKLVLPIVARQRSDAKWTSRTVRTVLELVTLVTIPLSSVTILVAPIAVPIAFGPTWDALVLPLQIGAMTLFFRGVDRILLSTARALGQMRSRAVFQVLQLLLVIGGVFATLPYGLAAVSAGYIATQAFALTAMIALLSVEAQIRLGSLLRAFVPGALLGAIPLAAAAAAAYGFGASQASGLPMIAGLGALAAASVALVALRRTILTPQVADLADSLVQRALARRGTKHGKP